MVDATIGAPGGFVPREALSFGTAGGPATAVDDANPLPVATRGTGVAYTDRSGMIAAGGAAQTICAGNPARRGFFVQNLSDGDLWLSTLGTAAAAQPALRIAAGRLYESPGHGVPTAAVSLYGATTGQAFAAREW